MPAGENNEAKVRYLKDSNQRILVKQVEFPPNEKWRWRAFEGWRQDIYGWTDEETGEVFPPTFSWYATIKGMRANPSPKAEYFYLRLRISGEQGKPLDERIARLTEERGVKEFDSYADCECVLGENCIRHGGAIARR